MCTRCAFAASGTKADKSNSADIHTKLKRGACYLINYLIRRKRRILMSVGAIAQILWSAHLEALYKIGRTPMKSARVPRVGWGCSADDENFKGIVKVLVLSSIVLQQEKRHSSRNELCVEDLGWFHEKFAEEDTYAVYDPKKRNQSGQPKKLLSNVWKVTKQ